MKKRVNILLILSIILLISLVAASFQSGANSGEIVNTYAPGDSLKGWINISLINEPVNSQLTAFSSNIKIKDFLDANNKYAGVDYFCSTSDCGSDYTSSAGGSEIKTFTLAKGASKLIGIKITEGHEISRITNFSLTVDSNANNSCINPLKIDILDNGETNWKAHLPSSGDSVNDYCGGEVYGCYNPSQVQQQTSIDTREFCNNLVIDFGAGLKVGADIQGSGDAEFTLKAFNDDIQKQCSVIVSEQGKISCILNISIESPTNFTVCINAKSSSSANKYTLGLEDINPCGSLEDYAHDFSIFAQGMRYEPLNSFVLDKYELQKEALSDLENDVVEYYIEDYISDKYDYNCSGTCYIPLRILSNQSQQVSLSNLYFAYEAGGIPKSTDQLYDISSSLPNINMPMTVLDISKANLKVPTSYGSENAILKLGGTSIINQTITIIQAPVINSVFPLAVPAAANIAFRADATGVNITAYKWDFGDNSSEITNTNTVSHKYLAIGTYVLNLTVESNLGSQSKFFNVKVENPEKILNSSLVQAGNDIESVKAELALLDSWIKDYIEKVVDFNNLETKINELIARYEQAGGSSTEYISIFNSLNELEIPDSLEITERFNGEFIIDKTKINPSKLNQLGAGSLEFGTDSEYIDTIFAWNVQDLDLFIDSKVYSLGYNNVVRPVVSIFNVGISPSEARDKIYLVIDHPKNAVEFKSNYGTVSDLSTSTGISLSDFSAATRKNIEFLVFGRAEIASPSIYFSPDFEEFVLSGKFGPCNFNKVCEEGENADNCRSDCKPIGRTILLLILLLLIAFAIYIALQEWYKRHYENKLFKNQDELYNLINFMDNAEKQGLSKDEMFRKLKEKAWKSEKLTYAYKKYKGKRTGMWEIPIFKLLEKKKVKKELEKRKKPVSKKPIVQKQNINKATPPSFRKKK